MVYFIILVVITLLLGSIVPFVQYFIYRSKKSTPAASAFLFSQSLLDCKMVDLKYEKVSVGDRVLIDRVALSDRGWVRGPNGVVMTAKDFEAKKKSEYEIALP